MGMYTALHFYSELKKDTPNLILATLKYMIGNIVDEPHRLPEHPLFDTPRWRGMLRTDSYYFDEDTHSTLRYDKIAKTHYLNVRSNVKNYDGEIEKFVDWIMPYCNKVGGDFLGFSRYEECEDPEIIKYKKDSK